MNGIYLTEQGKKEIENKIKELDAYIINTDEHILKAKVAGHAYCLENILKSATILPVLTHAEYIKHFFDGKIKIDDRFPNGLIIQPKNP